ncbi:TonB-dependent siderophore receptor [Pelagicoccus mobilis]|uniref:TonB-dependent receptor n=1 Tax=Pelagicoccus mobilis TaxID=415221 RepID=A0A934VJD9_9BACT|nr:TonB-dependent receptor [Pelagicoccus mobilis]MBK1875511.1 TonB-dependent receptor [Pelagicoccus mobilis]
MNSTDIPRGPTAQPLRVLTAAAVLSTSALLVAQEESEDVYELSPFTVQSDGDVGYQATNTASATRLNERLKDLPMSIEVINQQLLDDIAATNTVEALEIATGASYTEDANEREINFRGMNSRFQRRNQFIWYNPSDSFSTGRVEVIRGPQSLLYGQAEPGGLVNVTSKQALYNSQMGSVSLRLSDVDETRLVLDKNFGYDKFAFRVAGVTADKGNWREGFEEDLEGIYLTGNYRFFQNTTSIRFEFEDAERDQPTRIRGMDYFGGVAMPIAEDEDGNLLLSQAPFDKEKVGTWAGVDHSFKREWQSESFFLESEPTEWLSFQAAINRQEQGQEIYDVQGTNTIRFGSGTDAVTGQDFTDEYYVQAQVQDADNGNIVDTKRLTASLKFDAAGDHNLILGLQEREDFFELHNRQQRANNGNARGGGRRPALRFALNNGNDYSFASVPMELNGSGQPAYVLKPTFDIVNEETTDSYFAALSSKWKFGGEDSRLHTLVGFRNDEYVKINLLNGSTQDEGDIDSVNYGAVYTVNDKVNLYANFSESFKAPGAFRRDPDNNVLKPALGEGSEIGMKFDLVDNKVSGLLTYFTAEFAGDAVRLGNTDRDKIDPNNLNGRNGGGGQFVPLDTESQGIELQFRANLADGWTSSFGYAYIDATVGNDFSFQANFNDSYLADGSGNPVDADGNPILLDGEAVTIADFEIDPINGSILNASDLGLVGTGETGLKTIQYNGQPTPVVTVRNAGERLDPYAAHQINIVTNYRFQDGGMKGWNIGGSLRYRNTNYAGYTGSVSDGTRQLLKSSDYTVIDLFVGYQKKFEHVTWKSQVNLKNVLDKEYFPGRYLSYYGAPRQFIWTNTISF